MIQTGIGMENGLQSAPGAENLRGSQVYDTEGAEVGEVTDLVQEDAPEQGETPFYLEVARPSLTEFGLTKFWIPFDAVVAVDGDGITIETSAQHFEFGGSDTASETG